MKLSELLSFIKQQNLATVATVDANAAPEAAVVEFGELDDLTIIIDMLTSSRKYKNLQANKQVAVVIGWDDDITVQMNATATELSGEDLENAKLAYFAKNERAKKWADHPGIAYFALKPYWIKYSDVGQHPWVIQEFDLL